VAADRTVGALVPGADLALINGDLAPTRPEQRTWTRWHIAALWVGMAVCIPTYGLAAGLVAAGATLGVAVTAIAIGNLIVLVPLILNGHPGARYGIPFPVLIRASFGPVGAHIPTLIRGLVACGWFGIQTWIGGKALHYLAVSLWPEVTPPALVPEALGITTGQFLAFFAFWLLNLAIILRGIDTLKRIETWAAPFLLLLGLAMFVWAWHRVGDVGQMLSFRSVPEGGGIGTGTAFALGITGAVAFWGTLALNIPDFTRYARSQRDQALGQAISLPTTMTFYVFVGAAVTNATVLVFGTRLSDPVEVLARVGGPWVIALAMLGVIVATVSTNLAANVVSPANGFSNLAPRRIDFKKGAIIAAVIGLLSMPWKMWEDPDAYVVTWLVGCGGLLGAVGGIMIADYFVHRRGALDLTDLYRRGGRYEYRGGINPVAIVALCVAVAVLMPGFLATLKLAAPPAIFLELYKWSWFVAFAIAGGVYLVGMRLRGERRTPAQG
jgi:nucleobase:cation symporter-1, NCS1 family